MVDAITNTHQQPITVQAKILFPRATPVSRVKELAPVDNLARDLAAATKDFTQKPLDRDYFPKTKRVLLALARDYQPKLSNPSNEFRTKVYGDLKLSEPRIDAETDKHEKKIRDILERRTKPSSDNLYVDSCPIQESRAKLDQAKRAGKPYDVIITENTNPGQYIAPANLAAPIQEISPETFVVHYDRDPKNPIKTYTHVPNNAFDQGYTVLETREIYKLKDLLAKIPSPTLHHIRDRSKLIQHNILYLGPKDPQYQNRVKRTVASVDLEENKVFNFHSCDDYDPNRVISAIRRAKAQGAEYNTVILEENSWYPDLMPLAQRIKAELGDKALVYIFPTEKGIRDFRVKEIEDAKEPGIRALRFENLSLRGKKAQAGDLFEANYISPQLRVVLDKAKAEMVERSNDHKNKTPASISDDEALNSNYAWSHIYSMYPARFYLTLVKNEFDAFSVYDLLSCFCSEFYAAPHVNGGNTNAAFSVEGLKDKLDRDAREGLYYDAVFIHARDLDHYKEIADKANEVSPHTKIIVLTGLFTRDDLNDARIGPVIKGIQRKLEKRYGQGKVGTLAVLEYAQDVIATILRRKACPAISSRELLHTPGMLEMEGRHGRPYTGNCSDTVLRAYLDYN